ncbi:MAG: sodium-extruding oxaloacetate decarboxylase subunit alpha [Pseudomonadota bacterium]
MTPVRITDTILRDAHQSLIATRLRTEDMLPACPQLDAIGYWSLEVWGGATFDACVRYLREDPWERLRQLRAALPNTRLQMLLRGQNLLGYRHYADDVVRAFVRRAASNGIDVFRVFDALNDLRNLETSVAAVRENDAHAQGTICYTVSPVHTTEQFVQQARDLEAMGCHSLVIKDMAGLLTPIAAREMVTAITEAVTIPLHLHSHATAGLADICHFVGVEAGAAGIDTALSAFAGGTSHPPTESLVAALRETPRDSGLDLEALQAISAHFQGVRARYARHESRHTGVDTRVQVNQVPGGMISNLASQLRDQGAEDRMDEVLAEIPRVRAELGYPPLVTPTSQIVGTQAVMNVLSGERNRTISNEVKAYLQGRYGRPPAEVDPELRRSAIGRAEVITDRPADHLPDELERLRAEIGDLAGGEDDVLTYAMFPEMGRTFLRERAEGALQPEPLDPINDTTVCANGPAPTEFTVTVHGETYQINLRGSGQAQGGQRPLYLTIDGLPEEVMVETPDSAAPATGDLHGRPRASEPGHVTTSMPGTIVDVLVAEGDEVTAGQGVLVTEAMKMETEVQAPIAGRVAAVHVAAGDAVNPDETLIAIESA